MTSSHRLVVTQGARRNLWQLSRYTSLHWGTGKSEAYLRQLERAMKRLQEYPELGRSRDEIGPGVRSFLCADHVIYYRFTDEDVIVLRIFHVRMDTPREL